jgi:hypothetical protein
MSWLRLDDGFTKNPKFAGWTTAQKWAWLEVMEYCARYETEGRIPDDLNLLPRSATLALLHRAAASGWVDLSTDGSKWIHDWADYNPPRMAAEDLEQRVAEVLSEVPDASANEVCRRVGGRRKQVLAAIRRFRAGSHVGSRTGTGTESGTGSQSGSGTGYTRASPSRPLSGNTKDAKGRDGTEPSPGTGAAANEEPPPVPSEEPNAKLVARLMAYVDRVFDEYPDKDILREELLSYGATDDEADELISRRVA